MKYEKANVEVVKFDNSDVITTSGGRVCGPIAESKFDCDWAAQWEPGSGGEGPGAGEPYMSPNEFDAF